MRILHLIPAAPFGGAQRLTIDLAAHQRAEGLDASILFLNAGEMAVAEAQAQSIPYAMAGRGFARFAATRRQCKLADVIHIHMPPPWLGPVLPPQPLKLWHLHVRPPAQVHARTLRRRLDSLGERFTLTRTDRLIAISDWIAAAWTQQYPAIVPPISVVYNGITLPDPAPRPDGPFTIAIACRLSAVKGVEEFIAMAAAIHAQAPDVRFRIAGEGPALDEYHAMAKDAGLSDALTFEGFVSDMAAFWSKAHLAAFTPPFEPFGLRLVEPVGHGVPVVAYINDSGSDEVVDRCRGIAAVDYGEAAQLAALALTLRADPANLTRMAEQGRADVQHHFSLTAMADGIARAYQDAGEDRRSGAT